MREIVLASIWESRLYLLFSLWLPPSLISVFRRRRQVGKYSAANHLRQVRHMRWKGEKTDREASNPPHIHRLMCSFFLMRALVSRLSRSAPTSPLCQQILYISRHVSPRSTHQPIHTLHTHARAHRNRYEAIRICDICPRRVCMYHSACILNATFIPAFSPAPSLPLSHLVPWSFWNGWALHPQWLRTCRSTPSFRRPYTRESHCRRLDHPCIYTYKQTGISHSGRFFPCHVILLSLSMRTHAHTLPHLPRVLSSSSFSFWCAHHLRMILALRLSVWASASRILTLHRRQRPQLLHHHHSFFHSLTLSLSLFLSSSTNLEARSLAPPRFILRYTFDLGLPSHGQRRRDSGRSSRGEWPMAMETQG